MDKNTILSLTKKWGSHTQVSYGELLSWSKYTLLYFYPKDNTPGCTLEGQDFTRLSHDFLSLGIQVVGVSKDNSDSHAAFQSSCGIWLDLIADDGKLVDFFSVMGEKNMYGKIIFGLLRSSFLLDSEGNILKTWKNVRATGHAEKILREVPTILE